jgi:predicted Zn-dependent peptidase
VVREFEKELANLTEEQNRPQITVQQQVLETLLAAAFTAHRYRVPRNGWPGDLADLNRAAAKAFCEQHFVPGNIVAALVGDIDPAEAKRLAEKYFGPMPVRPLPSLPHTVEPVQQGPRTVALDQAGPAVGAIAYKRPSYFDKDDAALDLLEAILVSGKSGLAYRELVQEKKLAQNVQVLSTFPDGRYPNLFVILIHAAPGHTIEENQRVLEELLNRLRVQKVEPEALSDAQTQVQARLYGRLDSNAFLAQMLAVHTSAFGDWKKLFSLVDDLEKVTQDDVMRVVQRYLFQSNRTVVFTGPAGLPPRGGGVQ